LITGGVGAKLAGMEYTLADKIKAEHTFREFLRVHELPQPDEVEYGLTCLRFFYNDQQACVVFDLDPDADAEADEDEFGDTSDLHV
jgi:hypothetical protein